MSKPQRALITTAALLVAASLALAGPLPLSVLGPDNPQYTEILSRPYPVLGGGVFSGKVGGYATELWCVDSQRFVSVPQSGPYASVHLIWNIDQTWAVPEVRNSNVTGTGWTNYKDDPFWNTAKTRYTAAAWLIEQYSPNKFTPPNNTDNQTIQTAIWDLMHAGGSGATPDPGGWITAAKNAILAGYNAAGWAVLSWGVNAQGDLSGTAYQTFLVQVVPEPGFYGLLGLGLSALIFFARRRQSATS